MVSPTPSSNLDDLLGIGSSDPGVTIEPRTDARASAAATAPQFSSRREARAATASAPASRKLRRSESRLLHKSAHKPPHASKQPLRALATMGIVGGLFAVAGLPAYALTDNASALDTSASAIGVQSIKVSADAVVGGTARDAYRATSEAQMAEMTRDDIRAQNNADYLVSGARELGDDYPWYYELSEYQGAALSPLNYYYRQCTDFVAWRLNRDAGSFEAPFKWVWSNLTPSGGNASQWGAAWKAHGWTMSTTPVVGSVAWFGYSNHVAYVKAVNADGTVLIEEYNYVPNVYSQRTIPAASVESFLYPPT